MVVSRPFFVAWKMPVFCVKTFREILAKERNPMYNRRSKKTCKLP